VDKELKREIIMEHYSHPKNRKRMDDGDYIKFNTSNSSCIDNLDIYLKLNGNKIEDITFDGEACAISISSTSIMINNLIGMTVLEALDYIKNFRAMINEENYDRDLLKEALVYDDIYKQGNRKNCALLPYLGVEMTLNDYKEY